MAAAGALRTASCSCGDLVAQTRAEPLRVSICHCHACQRRTGSVFGVQARFRRDDVTIRGKPRTYVRAAHSGTRGAFEFCPRCGTTVHYGIEGNDEFIAIPVGAFADPTFPHPTRSVYEARRHAWVALPDGVEHVD